MIRQTTDRYREALARNLEGVKDRVARASERSGRSPDAVRVVAVTKGHPFDAVQAAVAAGLTDIGENRVEELSRKVQAAEGHIRPTWHLIGHVQRRKAQQAMHLFDLFHAVDSVRLARRLHSLAAESARTLQVLVQVNTSGEASKGGLSGAQALDELAAVVSLSGLQVRGLMTMAPFTDDARVVRRTFRDLRALHERASRDTNYRGTELSMGMTNDFEIAIEEGSTLVRLGTALFGERNR